MGFTNDLNRPVFDGTAIDSDLDQLRDNYHFILATAAQGSLVLPGWQTTVQGSDKSQPDSITLTRGKKKIIIYYTWTDLSVSAIQFCYDNGVGETSPSVTCYPAISFYYDDEGNPVGTTPYFEVQDLVLWLDASNRGSTTNQWDDLSGNNNHFTSPSAAAFPTFSGGAAVFDGSTKYVAPKGGADYFSSLTEGEIFARMKRYADNTDTGTNTGWWKFGTDSQTEHFTYNGSIYTDFGNTSRSFAFGSAIDVGTYGTLNIWSAASDWSFQWDGSTILSTGANTVAFPTGSTCAIGRSNASYYFQGSIKAIMLFNRKLTSDERTTVKNYMDAL